MINNLKNTKLTSLDDLFKSEEERQAGQQEQVLTIPADQIFHYVRQPYTIERPTPDLVRLMDSVERFGIMEPMVVRPRDGGGYEITDSHESWTGFLRAASYNYKCSFDEQILIYAQRPNATAVLELEKWNKHFGRWVNRGATGIAVFDDAGGKNRLKHYFDVSDTHEGQRARPVPIWEMDMTFEDRIIETLENTFGELSQKGTLVDAVLSASHNAVADNIPDYLRDLMDCREGSLLEELDELNVEVSYKRALESSVAYMLLARLSILADAYITPEDFSAIYDFNTRETINALGIATSDIAEMGLREISRTVMQARREQNFAKKEKAEYDTSRETTKAVQERSVEHGSDLQDAGRFSDSEPADAPGAGDASGQIRGAAPTVSEEAPESALHQFEDQLPPDGASGGDRANSQSDGI